MQTINKKDIPEIITVKIEKLSNLGLGIAKFEGYVIFVENTVPGDTVKIQVGKKNKSYANAKVLEIITPSPHRIAPFCPMQKICGGCQIQFIDYNYQLQLKKEIVKDAIKSIYGGEIEIRNVIPSPQNIAYRHKIQYSVSETKNSKRILAGYYKPATHELVNIKYCPIQPKYCDNIIEFIKNAAQACSISGYNEKKHSGDLRNVVIRTSAYNGKSLVVLVINTTKSSDKIRKLAEKIYKELDNISGVCVNFNNKKTNLILGEHTELLEGVDYVEEKLCNKIFKIGAKTFFQVNPNTAEQIFSYIKNYIKEKFNNPTILDAYAGIATFGICLSDIAQNVVSVEEVEQSVELAIRIIKENNIKNVKVFNMDTGQFLEREIQTQGRRFDVTVLDPPRKGCSKESLDYALQLTKHKIIYVSCNPATLARDLKYLKEQGCMIEFIQPFDMFPHTYHIENVAIVTIPAS